MTETNAQWQTRKFAEIDAENTNSIFHHITAAMKEDVAHASAAAERYNTSPESYLRISSIEATEMYSAMENVSNGPVSSNALQVIARSILLGIANPDQQPVGELADLFDQVASKLRKIKQPDLAPST
ncbi:hypothetical protein AB9F26_05950 [Falsihalocynthiibacter sp. BN13B15]|uniref:hypothetical protein n=1 Tax=Falsihalocynthiibacter sp. BN13B15 TaxID=3240871 RepID=UPI00350FB724